MSKGAYFQGWCLPVAGAVLLTLACSKGESLDESLQGPGSRRPDILLVSIDTLRADHVGCYGYERDTTPRLDRLAGEGLRFERAASHTPFTLTSHMSVFTSLLPSAHAMQRKSPPLDASIATLPELLRDAGYRTHGLYDCAWMNGEWGFARGFESYSSHQGVAAAALRSQELLEGAPKDAPLFLFLHIFDVHVADLRVRGESPYRAPAPYEDMFLPFPDIDHRSQVPEDVWQGRAEFSAQEAANIVANYDGSLRYVDDILGHILAVWDRERGAPDSVVLVTSDHGEALGDRGRFAGHGGAHVEGSHVPLLLRLPESMHAAHPPGTSVPWAVRSIDIAPTLLDLAGLGVPANMSGMSLLDVSAHRPQVFEHNLGQKREQRAYGDGRYRLVAVKGAEPQLFDLANDPREERPIQDAHPEIVARMLAELEEAQADAAARRSAITGEGGSSAGNDVRLDQEERERLRALGYLQDDEE